MLKTTLLALLLAVALSAVAAAWRRRVASRRARARARRALAGESAAEAMLERTGYTIVDRQARTTWRFLCDGEPVEAELRCDLLVVDGDRLLVAEVKTGPVAPRLDTAATRRQLLEYQLAYGADGVVLVDAEAGTVRRVDFPMPTAMVETPRRSPGRILAALALGAALGAALVQLLG